MHAATVSKASADFILPEAVSHPVHASSAVSIAQDIKDRLSEKWLPRLYREQVLTKRTRSHHLNLPKRKARVEVQHTLLGVELQIGRYRQSCPDLATARYLAVFARAGCSDVAVPYDISQISRLADELESSWQRMLLMIQHTTEGRSMALRTRVRSLLIKQIRSEMAEAGAGTAVPQFNQNTRQRRG